MSSLHESSYYLSTFNSQLSTEKKSFPFSVLILLRSLFTAPPRHSVQALSALGLIAAFRFPTPSENRKTKSFPLSAFRFPFFCVILFYGKVRRDI